MENIYTALCCHIIVSVLMLHTIADAAISVALPLGAPLTAKNLGSALADTSTDSSEIILTIVELDDAESHVHNEARMDEVQNFLTHLSDFGRAHNVLLIGGNDR